METRSHIEALRAASARLSAAAAAAGPGTAVPTCPGWVVRDLVRHQGGVHRWADGIVGTPRTGPWRADIDEIVGTWPDDADLITWFGDGAEHLARTLTEADPALTCWTFLAAPSPLAMWSRRQAHETSMHAVDAELAAGWPAAEVPAPFAADGVSELLTCFITRPRGELRADPAVRLRVRCTDAEGDWLVTIGPDRVVTATAGQAGSGRAAGPDSPGADFPATDSSGADLPAADSPGADLPAADSPAADSPAADSPAADSPGADCPATDSPAADFPAADSPAADSPAADSPGADCPATDSPAADSPAADSPAADCEVSGRAGDLYLALWNRRPASELAVHGDASVLGLFLDRVHVRWS